MTQNLIFDEISYALVPRPELIAFWHYDHYPYTLYGKVVGVNRNGGVTTKEFGVGFWFTPKQILPEHEASAVIEELDRLKLDRQKALNLVEKEYQIKLAELSKRFDIPMPVHVFK